MRLSFSGSYPLDLPSLGDPTGSIATTRLALRVTETCKPFTMARSPSVWNKIL